MRRKILQMFTEEVVPESLIEDSRSFLNQLIVEAHLAQKNASTTPTQLSFSFVRQESTLRMLTACKYPPAALIKLVAHSGHTLRNPILCPTHLELNKFLKCQCDTISAVLLAIHIVDCEQCLNFYQQHAEVAKASYTMLNNQGFVDVSTANDQLGFLGQTHPSQIPPSSTYPQSNFNR